MWAINSKPLSLLLLVLMCSGCASLHHIQVGEIDDDPDYVLRPLEIKINETGVNIQEAGKIAKVLAKNSAGRAADQAASIIGLFQMGPRTGNPVYTDDYARDILQIIYEKCPSGRLTGLMSIRETRKYPVISGEIIKIKGYCMLPKLKEKS